MRRRPRCEPETAGSEERTDAFRRRRRRTDRGIVPGKRSAELDARTAEGRVLHEIAAAGALALTEAELTAIDRAFPRGRRKTLPVL